MSKEYKTGYRAGYVDACLLVSEVGSLPSAAASSEVSISYQLGYAAGRRAYQKEV